MALSKELQKRWDVTGKSLEEFLEASDPARYKRFCEKQTAETLREYRKFVERRNVERSQQIVAAKRKADADAELDAAHRRLALSIAETIRLDEEYERRWETIKVGLIGEGAPRKMTD